MLGIQRSTQPLEGAGLAGAHRVDRDVELPGDVAWREVLPEAQQHDVAFAIGKLVDVLQQLAAKLLFACQLGGRVARRAARAG